MVRRLPRSATCRRIHGTPVWRSGLSGPDAWAGRSKNHRRRAAPRDSARACPRVGCTGPRKAPASNAMASISRTGGVICMRSRSRFWRVASACALVAVLVVVLGPFASGVPRREVVIRAAVRITGSGNCLTLRPHSARSDGGSSVAPSWVAAGCSRGSAVRCRSTRPCPGDASARPRWS